MGALSYFKHRCYINQRGTMDQTLGTDDVTDIIAYLDSAQDKPATIRSPTWFWDSSLRVARPQDLKYSYNFRSSMINNDIDIFYPLPLPNASLDFILFADAPQEIKNKTITPLTNTLTGIEKLPDYRKTGKFQGSNLKGEGLMESLIHKHLPELKGDSIHGSYVQYTTPISAESNTGNYVPNQYLTMGKFDPIIKIKARIPDFAVSTNRFFFGFTTASLIINGDTPSGLNDSTLMIGFRKDDSDFKLIRTYGDGVTIINPLSTNETIDTDVFILELGFRNEGTRVYYRINEGQEIEISSSIPQNTRWLKLHSVIENTNVNNAKTLDLFYSRIESSK